MKNHHYDSLNDLGLDQAIRAVKTEKMVELAASKDFWDSDEEEEYEQREEELYGYFERKEKEYSALLGNPVFKGGMDNSGFPENYMETFHQSADYLVIWEHSGERYGLSIVQEDREFPFVVAFLRFPAG